MAAVRTLLRTTCSRAFVKNAFGTRSMMAPKFTQQRVFAQQFIAPAFSFRSFNAEAPPKMSPGKLMFMNLKKFEAANPMEDVAAKEIKKGNLEDPLMREMLSMPMSAWMLGNYDEEASEKFTKALHHFGDNEDNMNEWAKTIHGRLSLILLFDQQSRKQYKGTLQAFAWDDKAIKLCKEVCESKERLDKTLEFQHRVLFYFPLGKSEDVATQELHVRMRNEILADAREAGFGGVGFMEKMAELCPVRLQCIQRFGRFPRRNAVFGRETTAEEQKYMDDNPNRAF